MNSSCEYCKQGTILVVDDELELSYLFQVVLENEGYRIFTAEDTTEALRILQTQKIGQLWIDNSMPIKTGIEFVRELRSDPNQYPFVLEMPIVLISGTRQKDLRVEDQALFTAFFSKPFDLDEVINLAKRLDAKPLGV